MIYQTGNILGLMSSRINSESLKHADHLVCLLLSSCFICMFTHCYMPSSMVKSIIVPLVKNKCGNLADKNNYRPIALFNMSFCFALKIIYGLTLINLNSSSHISLIFLFMLLQNLLSKVDSLLFTWHSLTLGKLSTKVVIGHFIKK